MDEKRSRLGEGTLEDRQVSQWINLPSRFQEASCVNLTDEETKTLKGQVTCPGSHSKSLVNSFDKLVSVFTGTIVQQ